MFSERRKSKCDRRKPCSLCVARGDPSSCVYEAGHAPLPAVPTVPLADFLTLHRRLQGLEEQLRAPASTSDNLPDDVARAQADDQCPSARQEKAFIELEGLSYLLGLERTDRDRDGEPVQFSSPTDSPSWPDIVLHSFVVRSAKWNQDMLSIFEALPTKVVMDQIVDYFFTEVQIIREPIGQSVSDMCVRSLPA